MDPLWILCIGMLVVMGGILALRLHAFLALIAGALIVAAITPASSIYKHALSKKESVEAAAQQSKQPAIQRVTREFGAAAGRIGLLIALGSILGKCLLESGGAERIVRSTLRAVGEKRASLALLASGFTLGIPVFFEAVFFLMLPLAKVLRARTGKDFTLYMLSIIGGATMTHSLVPPTPGPLLVAVELKVNLGTMILWGLVVGVITAGTGWIFAHWLNRKVPAPERELEEAAPAREEKTLPPLWIAALPIIVPVVLISLDAMFEVKGLAHATGWSLLLQRVSEANIALAISVSIALGTLLWQGRTRGEVFSKIVGSAIDEAGSVLLIISAGGAFGGALQQSGIGARMLEHSTGYSIGILPLAWLITAVVRTAQGSATVAMVTAVGVVSGMAKPEALGFHPVWLALAIGCGSKMVPWMNDGGFWIISRMTGYSEKQMLSTMTPLLGVMGVTGLVTVVILAKLFPLI